MTKTTSHRSGTRRTSNLYAGRALLVCMASLLGACDMVLLNPAGDVAKQQSNLLIAATFLMLLIVVPVILLTLWFAWRYRETNEDATHTPDWDHSTQLELYIWSAPLLIIIALGALTWVGTHTLDPFRALGRISPDKPIPENVEPLEIQAIALEWKWLFVYPQYGIATVNEVAAPVDMPISFKITSPDLMNSLFIPSLAGMVYAMPGMQTQIQAVINEPGDYYGVSGNYSGEGYSGMRFTFKGQSNDEFERWLESARASAKPLTTASYMALTAPSINHPVERFSTVEPSLYGRILNRCVEPGKPCVHATMRQGTATGDHSNSDH